MGFVAAAGRFLKSGRKKWQKEMAARWLGGKSLLGKGSHGKHLQNLKCNIRRKRLTFAGRWGSPRALPAAVLIRDKSRETLV